MENHETKRHPGPWRVMRVDSEFAGLLVAVGFLMLGLVSMPLATGFVLGAIALGVVVALLLRFAPRKFNRMIVGTLIIFVAFLLWWAGHKPRRPDTVSSNAVYILPNNVPLRLFQTGLWLECWFDQHANVDRCKLTDKQGTVSFEDVFIQCESCAPLPQSELVFEWQTGRSWIQSCDKKVNAPLIYVAYGQTLVPRSLYKEARQEVQCH
jgi:hypothetical protein